MSDQDLHCLLTGNSIKNKMKIENCTTHPKFGNGLVQLISMEGSTRQMWVNLLFQTHELLLSHEGPGVLCKSMHQVVFYIFPGFIFFITVGIYDGCCTSSYF